MDLQLHEVLNPWLSSPEALTDALSGMAQLRSLSLHFLPITGHLGVSQLFRKRAVLPALTCLDFRGITNYLEDLVAGLDAPRLGEIEVTFFEESISDLSRLSKFVDQIGSHNAHRQAHILSSSDAISVSFTQPGVPTCINLQVSCEQLSEQLSFLTRVCDHFSTFIYDVEDLRISARQRQRREGNLCGEQWLKSFKSFTGVKWLHFDGQSSVSIMRALEKANTRGETLLPGMHKLCIPQPWSRNVAVRKVAMSLLTSHRVSGRSIVVEYERLCDISEPHEAGTL